MPHEYLFCPFFSTAECNISADICGRTVHAFEQILHYLQGCIVPEKKLAVHYIIIILRLGTLVLQNLYLRCRIVSFLAKNTPGKGINPPTSLSHVPSRRALYGVGLLHI